MATNAVTISVSAAGHLLGVGNGDPASHESDTGSKHSAFNGLCLAIIQSYGTPGTINLQADEAGLKSAAVTLEAR